MGCMPSYQLPPPPCRALGKASPKSPKMLCMVAAPPFVSFHICMYHICITYVSGHARLRIDITVSLVSGTIIPVSCMYQYRICIGPCSKFQLISHTNHKVSYTYCSRIMQELCVSRQYVSHMYHYVSRMYQAFRKVYLHVS